MSSTPTKHASTRHQAALRAAYRVLGVVPLAAYAGHHVYVQSAALYSREAWIERVHRLAPTGFVAWLMITLLFAHFAIGAALLVVRHQKRAQSGRDAAGGDRWLGPQTLFGAILLAFVVFHVRTLGVPMRSSYELVRASYETLSESLGRPLPMVGYVLGITALAFHVGTGIASLLEERLRGPRLARYLAGALAFSLWVLFLQVFARFAIGESLIPGM